MTTFTLTGARFVEDGDHIDFASTATLQIVATENYLFTYSFIPPAEPGFASDIDISPARGDDYLIRLNGYGFNQDSPFSGAYVSEITWGDGNISQVLILDFGDPEDSYSIFQLNGDALPNLTTLDEADAFMETIKGVTEDFGGAFGANMAIDLRNLDAFSGLTENDVIIADARYEDWEGRVIRTGIGHDKVIAIGANDEIELGSGNDTAKGGNGNDTISGGTGQDNLVGGNGADFLKGGTGNDVLNGGTGKDQLLGGSGSDRFVFASGHGTDTVLDFENDIDTLRFSTTLGVETVEQALAAAIDFGNNVIFGFGGSNVLTVIGTTKAQLADDIVIF